MPTVSSIQSAACNLSIDQLQTEKVAITKRLASLSSMIVSLRLYETASSKNPNLLEIIEDIEKIVGKYQAGNDLKP